MNIPKQVDNDDDNGIEEEDENEAVGSAAVAEEKREEDIRDSEAIIRMYGNENEETEFDSDAELEECCSNACNKKFPKDLAVAQRYGIPVIVT
jgi:hypothetical protein